MNGDLAADISSVAWQRATKAQPGTAAATSQVGFEQAIEPLMPDLLRYFVRRITPREDAADLLSETLLVLWKHRARLPSQPDEQRAWAYGVARKVLSNHIRKQARRTDLRHAHLLRASLSASSPAPVSPAAESALDALASLSERDQELIRLVIWDGFGVGEAGAVLGMKESTARSRYARAKSRLRHELEASRPEG